MPCHVTPGVSVVEEVCIYHDWCLYLFGEYMCRCELGQGCRPGVSQPGKYAKLQVQGHTATSSIAKVKLLPLNLFSK